MLFSRAEPGKLGVEQGEGFCRGFRGCRTGWDGLGWRRQEGAAGAQVTPVGPATTSTEAAALQKGFVKENVGGFGHELSSDTTFAPGAETSKQKAL